MNSTITKDFKFEAAHHLTGLPADHQCSRVHGHSYVVRVSITGQIVYPGWVVDYGELKPFGAWIDEHLDHQDLNDRVPVNPTAENLAWHLLPILRRTIGAPTNVTEIGVGVAETAKSWAWVNEPW